MSEQSMKRLPAKKPLVQPSDVSSASASATASDFAHPPQLFLPPMPFPAHSSISSSEQRPVTLDYASMCAAVDAGMPSQLYEPSAADFVSIPAIVAFLKSHPEPQLLEGEYNGFREKDNSVYDSQKKKFACSLRIHKGFTPVVAPSRPVDQSEIAVSAWWERHRWPHYTFEGMFKSNNSELLIPVRGVFIPGQYKVTFSNVEHQIEWKGLLQFYPHARAAAHVQLVGHLHNPSPTRRGIILQSHDRCNLQLNINALVCAEALEGSPIQHQSVTTLAVMCRYLTLPELLHTYRSCKLLQQAACHPLTFQHNLRIGVDEWTGAFVRGPGGSFSLPAKLRDAMTHRPFKGNFRILTLGSAIASSFQLLQEMTHPDAPCLRSLNLYINVDDPTFMQGIRGSPIQIGNSSNSAGPSLGQMWQEKTIEQPQQLPAVSSQALASLPLPMSDWPSMKFLRLLQLNLAACNVSLLRYCIPASLEILQLTFIVCSRSSVQVSKQDLFDDDLPTILRENRQARNIRQVVIRCQAAVSYQYPHHSSMKPIVQKQPHRSEVTNDEDFTMLEQLVTIDHLEQVHWLIPIDCSTLVNEYHVAPIKRIPKIRALRMTAFNFKQAIPILTLFPALARLDIANFLMDEKSFHQSSAWPPAVVANMEEIIVHSASVTQAVSRPAAGNGFAFIGPTPVAASARPVAIDAMTEKGKSQEQVESVALIDPYQNVLNTLTSASTWPNLTRLQITQNSEVSKRLQLEDMFRSMPSLTDLTLENIVVNQPRCFVLLKNLKTLRDFTWPYVGSHMEEFRATDFPSLSYLHVSHVAAAPEAPAASAASSSSSTPVPDAPPLDFLRMPMKAPARAPPATEASMAHNSLSTYLHLIKQIESLKTLKWRRSKALNPHTAVIDVKVEQERLQRVAAMSGNAGMTKDMREQIAEMENKMAAQYASVSSSYIVPVSDPHESRSQDAASNRLRLAAGMPPIGLGQDPSATAFVKSGWSAAKQNRRAKAAVTKQAKLQEEAEVLEFAGILRYMDEVTTQKPTKEKFEAPSAPVAATSSTTTEEIDRAIAAMDEEDLADILMNFSLGSGK